MKKKLGIITFHDANNYGAVLQAIATVIIFNKKVNIEAGIINYYNPTISDQLDLIRYGKGFRNIMRFIKDVVRLPSRLKVVKKYRKFINEHGNLTEKCNSVSEISDIVRNYSYLVSGSDQIWNPECQDSDFKLNSVYFLDFGPEEIKKISYATSFGDYVFSEKELDFIKIYLSKYQDISLRESSSAKLLKDKIGCDVNVVLDPTLLVSPEDWRSLSNSVEGIKEDFILVYLLNRNDLNREAVSYIRTNYPDKEIVVIDQAISTAHKGTRQLRDIGPAEFIWLFSKAELVITDSFHGCCFSINFGKKFMAVTPPKRVNRITDLLSELSLDNRLIRSNEDFSDFSMIYDIDKAQSKLNELKFNSFEFVNKNIV